MPRFTLAGNSANLNGGRLRGEQSPELGRIAVFDERYCPMLKELFPEFADLPGLDVDLLENAPLSAFNARVHLPERFSRQLRGRTTFAPLSFPGVALRCQQGSASRRVLRNGRSHN